MSKKYKSISYLMLFSMISLLFPNSSASALTYQSSVGVSFDFSSSLTLTLSSNSLVVSNLAPGASGNSNEINVSVVTNNAYGYKINATVGSSTNATRDLKHTASGSSAKFSSINFNASSSNYPSSLSTDNTWGYSIDSGSHYNGLPLYTDTTNIAVIGESNDPANDSIPFLIGAKAASSQASGEYTNIINFQAVTNPSPITLSESYKLANKTKQNGYYKMQDMTTSICEAVEVDDDQLQVIDTRDNKVYWIAKLQDGHCWMTQNLDLDLGVVTLTHSSTTLYHDDTDLGWGSDTATTSWTPVRSTINATSGTITGWANDDNTPYSIDTGDWYYAGYDGTTLLTSTNVNYLTSANKETIGGVTTVYNNANHDVAYFKTAPFSGSGTSNNGTHGHVGNYYNWSSAVASNDTSGYTGSTYGNIANNPQNSICPAGWRLPTITSASPTYSSDGSKNEFARLANLYAGYSGSNSLSSAGLEASPLFLARGGYVYEDSLYLSGNFGYYWSSSVGYSSGAYDLYFGATDVCPANYDARSFGRSVRCVAR